MKAKVKSKAKVTKVVKVVKAAIKKAAPAKAAPAKAAPAIKKAQPAKKVVPVKDVLPAPAIPGTDFAYKGRAGSLKAKIFALSDALKVKLGREASSGEVAKAASAQKLELSEGSLKVYYSNWKKERGISKRVTAPK